MLANQLFQTAENLRSEVRIVEILFILSFHRLNEFVRSQSKYNAARPLYERALTVLHSITPIPVTSNSSTPKATNVDAMTVPALSNHATESDATAINTVQALILACTERLADLLPLVVSKTHMSYLVALKTNQQYDNNNNSDNNDIVATML
jgi:hypothetical protein